MIRPVVVAFLALFLFACKSHDRDRHPSEPGYGDTSKSTSTAGTTTGASLSREERGFAEKALQGGQFEVEASRVALLKASSGKVRDFANMMIADHGQANQDLENLARKKGIYPSTMLDPEHQAMLDELRQLDGPEFDKRFREMQIEAHDAAIRLFDEASRECHDVDLRTFASRMLPTLQQHRGRLDEVTVATNDGR